MNDVVTSVKIPKILDEEFSQRVIRDGYGMRGKSKWICECIEMFLELSESDYPEYVSFAVALEEQRDKKIVSVRLSKHLAVAIDKAVRVIRGQFPEMEGVRSHIIRASIMQRLLRS